MFFPILPHDRDQLLATAARETEKAVIGYTKTPAPTKGSVDVIHSPNFLQPLVAAFTAAATEPSVAADIRGAIVTVRAGRSVEPKTENAYAYWGARRSSLKMSRARTKNTNCWLCSRGRRPAPLLSRVYPTWRMGFSCTVAS